MDSTELKQAMRDLEYFHHLRCLPGAWIVLRLDGRSFSKLTASQFDKPFDIRFRDVMHQTCKALLEKYNGSMATRKATKFRYCSTGIGTCLIAKWKSWFPSQPV